MNTIILDQLTNDLKELEIILTNKDIEIKELEIEIAELYKLLQEGEIND